MSRRTRTWPSLFVTASLVFLATGSAEAAVDSTQPAAEPPGASEAAPVAPSGDSPAAPTDAAAPTDGADAVAPPPEDPPAAAGAADEPVAPGAVPAPPLKEPETAPMATPTDPPAAAEREGTDLDSAGDPAESEAPVSPGLLESEDDGPVRAPPARRTVVQDEGAQAAAIAAAFDNRYRPEDNPGRLNISSRLLFANAGGDGDVGGRMGGAQVDVGQAWNRVGYALTASAWGGRILLGDRVSEMNAMFGVGPTLNLGRAALQQRGIIDFRVGYDFMYSVVNQRSENTILATQSDSDVQFVVAKNLIPHGPRALLQLGLVSPGNHRKYFNGFGVVMGYQGLVGSLRGELPFTHMLVTGLTFWMG